MRKLLILLALTAVVALAGACGSSEDEGSSGEKAPEKAQKPTAVETVQVAYRETAAEQTAKTSFEVTTTAPLAGPENAGQNQPMTFTMRGQGVVDFSGAASSMTTEMFGMGSFQMRQVEDTIYMKMPKDFVAQMPGAKPWLEADLEAMYGQQYDASPAQMQGGGAQDPTRQLEYLRGVSDSVEKVGEEEVRGVRTTRYEAIVDLEKEAAGQGDEAKKAQDEIVEQLGTSKIPVEVWLDEQNRVRRYAINMTVPVPANAASPSAARKDATMRTQMVAEYYDFGTPVNVQAPPPIRPRTARSCSPPSSRPRGSRAIPIPGPPIRLKARDALT